MAVKPDEMEEILLKTLQDGRLSRSERQVLTDLFAEHRGDPDKLVFFRHRAFAIARDRLDRRQQRLVLDWLEQVVKALAKASEPDTAPRLAEAHFSPGDTCRRRIVSLLAMARHTVDVCVFTITDDRISKALLEAHWRGVRVRVITDDDKSEDRGSDVEQLAHAGIRVRLDNSEHHMHHKFALVDSTYLVTGSYNWTRSAAAHNEENIVVTSEARLVGSFGEVFDRLWKDYAQGQWTM